MKKIKLAIILLAGLMASPQTANAQFFKKLAKTLDKLSSTTQQSTYTPRNTSRSNYSTSTRSEGSSYSTSQKQNVASSNDEVTLVVSADGATKEEATKVALRSAIEQAYGTFVSANTTILNDELVKDEIVTVSQGNIKSYSEIASERTPDGKNFVTLRATVCISKLVSYAKSKGASTEFAGAAFAMNMKMKELNKQNEEKALANLAIQIDKMMPYAFDYKLEIEGPMKIVKDLIIHIDNNYLPLDERGLRRLGILPNQYDNYYISLFTVNVVPNKQMNSLIQLVLNTFKSLALTQSEIKDYYNSGLETYKTTILARWNGIGNINAISNDIELTFRSMVPDKIEYINFLIAKILYNFELVDNTGTVSYIQDWQLVGEIGRHKLFGENGTNLFKNWAMVNTVNGCNEYFRYWPLSVNLFTREEIIAKIPIFIPVNEINKYSNFEIRRRTTPMKCSVQENSFNSSVNK